MSSDSDVMISVRGLGKAYTIAHDDQRITTLAEAAVARIRHPFHRQQRETFWALKDVSFDVRRGDVVGVIGRNGAGKSTLFKILSRVTEPTTGRVDLYGRVGALLEVGTGFSGELTGRENIYLNGAILGMTKAEIRRQFDGIVSFAGVEKFLDTPVKRYSSGMYVRLAFAVAAHLRSEILIVDEVLTVGDAEFQKKCFGKIDEVAGAGRTVLFVSHNMAALARLCRIGILLESGQVAITGSAESVLDRYLRSGLSSASERKWMAHSRPGNDIARLARFRVRSVDGETIESVEANEPFGLEMEYEVLESGQVLVPNFHVFSDEGTCLFVTQELSPEWRGRPRPAGTYVSTAWVSRNLMAEGTVVVGAALTTFDPMTVHFYERDAIVFRVVEPESGESARGDYQGSIPGAVRPLLNWTTRRFGDADQLPSMLAKASS